jgi:copper chaperone CopZ
MLQVKNTPTALNSTFTVEGMTCQKCVKTITEKMLAVPGVTEAVVSLENKNLQLKSTAPIDLQTVQTALNEHKKYSISNFVKSSAPTKPIEAVKPAEETSLLKTYKPLITVFAFVFLIATAYQISLDKLNPEIFMNHIMAGFFIGLSFFKFLDLKAFAESFSSYDPIAQRWLNYGYVYAFLEVFLGLLFVSGKLLILANSLTVIVLSATTYGVYKRLKSKSKFQCACLGTTFNLPLSNVTIAENLVMILMAATNLMMI